MDVTLEKQCSALGGLFQCIIGEMKNCGPVWDDVAQKATKLHLQLKSVAMALNMFFDALQRVADLAASARGATKDIGTALTKVCMRHRAIENRLKSLSSGLIDCLVSPMQARGEEWRRTVCSLDKEHSREYKRAKSEIKKTWTRRRIRKGPGDSGTQCVSDATVQRINDRYGQLLETETQAVRQALIEQRSHFCSFVSWLKPFLDGELALLNEFSQLEEVVDLLNSRTQDPFSLPASSEAVITDSMGVDSAWRFRTPPSSPGSSLGSRKSSYCSLGADRPTASYVSSDDLGIWRAPPPSMTPCQSVQLCESDSEESTPSPAPSAITWPTRVGTSSPQQRPRSTSVAGLPEDSTPTIASVSVAQPYWPGAGMQRIQRPRRPFSFASSDETAPFFNMVLSGHKRGASVMQEGRTRAIPPPPPVRRSSSITAATPSAPAVDFVRSCAMPGQEESIYAAVKDNWTCSDSGTTGSRQPGDRCGFRADSEPPIGE